MSKSVERDPTAALVKCFVLLFSLFPLGGVRLLVMREKECKDVEIGIDELSGWPTSILGNKW